MILTEVEKTIKREMKRNEFLYPFYEKYCISNIPSTILKLFNIKHKTQALPSEVYKSQIENFNKIVLILLDGISYYRWKFYSKRLKILKDINSSGLLSPLTSVFPSTTTASITTMNTGLTPQEHALFEWILYFKEIDMIIKTLLFSPLDENCPDTLLKKGINPKILYNGTTIYQNLNKEDIKSFVFISSSYSNSVYSKLVYKGSSIVPFIKISDMVTKLKKFIENEKGPAYIYVYIDDTDIIEHQYGSNSEEFCTELSLFFLLFKRKLLENIDKRIAKETLLIITSDHGQINISPEKTIYLNKYKKLILALEKNRKNKPILPTGSPRDVFLHIQEEKINKIQEFLSNELRNVAKVIKIEEALSSGLFGKGKVKKEFYERAGNLLILPYKNNTVWFKYNKKEKVKSLSYHGGLSMEEMLVPFYITKLSNLIR